MQRKNAPETQFSLVNDPRPEPMESNQWNRTNGTEPMESNQSKSAQNPIFPSQRYLWSPKNQKQNQKKRTKQNKHIIQKKNLKNNQSRNKWNVHGHTRCRGVTF